jgi:hypothetical protein
MKARELARAVHETPIAGIAELLERALAACWNEALEPFEELIKDWVHDCPPVETCYKCGVEAAIRNLKVGERAETEEK